MGRGPGKTSELPYALKECFETQDLNQPSCTRGKDSNPRRIPGFLEAVWAAFFPLSLG